MKKANLNTNYPIARNYYSELGHYAEAVFRFTYDGTVTYAKGDNKAHIYDADVADYQVKTYSGRIADFSLSIEEYLANDKAQRYAYIPKAYGYKIAYIFDKAEWYEFISKFNYADYDSRTGKGTRRITREPQKMLKWLEDNCNGFTTL